MDFLLIKSSTAPYEGEGNEIWFGYGFETSSNIETEHMLRPHMAHQQPTECFGTTEVIRSPSLTGQEIVAWLRSEKFPIDIIADIAVVKDKSVLDWLGGGAVNAHDQERLKKIYSLLNENKLTNFRHLYRYWNRRIIGEQSLSSMLKAKVLDEISIRNALSRLWPLAKKEEIQENLYGLNTTTTSIKNNPFLRESREVTTSYDP